MILGVAGDVLWVLAVMLMAGVSQGAWRRTAPGQSLPFLGASAPRALALWFVPAAAIVLSFGLSFWARRPEHGADVQLIAFGLRATGAAGAALLHLSLVRRALSERQP